MITWTDKPARTDLPRKPGWTWYEAGIDGAKFYVWRPDALDSAGNSPERIQKYIEDAYKHHLVELQWDKDLGENG